MRTSEKGIQKGIIRLSYSEEIDIQVYDVY